MSSEESFRDTTEFGDTVRIEQCLVKFQSNQDVAFDDLAELIFNRFRRLTAHILNEQSPAVPGATDRASHEAFLRFREALKREQVVVRTKEQLCTLAATHIRFALSKLVRRYRRDDVHRGPNESLGSDGLAAAVEIPDSTLDPARLAAWTEFQEGIERLDPELRQIVDLLFFDGLSPKAAGEMLSISATTVNWRWKSAKVRLALGTGGTLLD